MLIPKPYFKNVPGYGNLEMEQVIVNYVYPLLSVLKDSTGNRYLCMCFDTREAQQWLVTPISIASLVSLLKNESTLASPFEDPYSKKILAVMDYQTREEMFQLLDADEIPKEYLPADGEYLDSESGEWDEYIKELKTVVFPFSICAQVIYHGGRDRASYMDAPWAYQKAGRYTLCVAR